jgi:hypothetical protein
MHKECAKALTGCSVALDMDGVVRQTFVAVLGRDTA